MPVTYKVFEDEQVVIATYSGVTNDEEILNHIKAMNRDARIKSGHREIANMLPLERANVSNGLVHEMANLEIDSKRIIDSRVAIVVEKDIFFGLSRMYQTIAEKYRPNIEVFRNMQKAKDWLGLSDWEI